MYQLSPNGLTFFPPVEEFRFRMIAADRYSINTFVKSFDAISDEEPVGRLSVEFDLELSRCEQRAESVYYFTRVLCIERATQPRW